MSVMLNWRCALPKCHNRPGDGRYCSEDHAIVDLLRRDIELRLAGGEDKGEVVENRVNGVADIVDHISSVDADAVRRVLGPPASNLKTVAQVDEITNCLTAVLSDSLEYGAETDCKVLAFPSR